MIGQIRQKDFEFTVKVHANLLKLDRSDNLLLTWL